MIKKVSLEEIGFYCYAYAGSLLFAVEAVRADFLLAGSAPLYPPSHRRVYLLGLPASLRKKTLGHCVILVGGEMVALVSDETLYWR